jgi:ABC-type transport system substrate-binding protein
MLWDWFPPMTPAQARELKAARGDEVTTYVWPQNTAWALHLNTHKPPFNNIDMRKAVYLGLDRDELFEKIFEGSGVACAIMDPVIHGGFALPLAEVYKLPGCRKDKREDLAEARRLVAKHYPNGVDIDLEVRTVGNYVDRTQVVAAQLAKIGIRGKIKTYESAAGYSVFGKGEFTLIGTQDTAMVLTDPSGPIGILYTTGAGRNYSDFSDPVVDKLAEAGLREEDVEKRKKIYHDLQRHLLTQLDHGTVMIGWINAWFFTDRRLKNLKAAPMQYDAGTFMKVWIEP